MHIEFISPEDQLNPENDSADVLLRLDDGRVYGLLVATPNNIYSCMASEANDYYFGVPPLLVKKLNRNSVEVAVRALLQSPWFATYATLQSA